MSTSSSLRKPLREKPLSPHLFIYKPQITSVLSILHRITGIITYFGVLVCVWWVLYIAYYVRDYHDSWLYLFFCYPFGKFLLMCFTFSIFFHMCMGVRYLFWDVGKGFDLKTVTITGWAAVIAALSINAIFWYMYFL